jgi:hypothetical protein
MTTKSQGTLAKKQSASRPPKRTTSGEHASARSDEGTAFLPDPYDGGDAKAHTDDAFAEALAEDFVSAATSAEEVAEDERDEVSPEELGGPFTETTAAEEVAMDEDESNPEGSDREPFPTAVRPRD